MKYHRGHLKNCEEKIDEGRRLGSVMRQCVRGSLLSLCVSSVVHLARVCLVSRQKSGETGRCRLRNRTGLF